MKKSFDNRFLNDCLDAYIRTYTINERLQEFIEKKGFKDKEKEIFNIVDGVISTATGYIYDYKSESRIEWNKEFEKKHFDFIAQKHEWLSPKGYERIKALCSWLCWHDGL